jgi:hypothetical protein
MSVRAMAEYYSQLEHVKLGEWYLTNLLKQDRFPFQYFLS